jgi:integrase
MGQIRCRGKIWWVRYYRDGRRYEESSHSTRKDDAKTLLKLREGDIARGVPVTPKIGRLRFEEAATDVVNDYRVNGRRSLDDLERRIKLHLQPFFGGRRMSAVTTSDVRAYIAKRQADVRVVGKGDVRRETPTSAGEINRELTALKRMFSLAVQAGKLIAKPHIPMLKENNVRTGFFDREQFEAVRRRLPEDVQPVVTLAHITGWRLGEILPLQWRQVDFAAGEVRLDPGTTKNDEGRVFPMTTDLQKLLNDQRARTDEVQRRRGAVCPWVFHRDGRPIKSIIVAWRSACRSAGCPGRIVHDLRRSAVRNMVRAGIAERVAMQMTGHKTRSVFERYDIVSGSDLRDAAKRLEAAMTGKQGTAEARRKV